MSTPPPGTRLAFLVDVVKLLAAPIIFIVTGVGVFVYEVGWGHSQAFGITGLALALTAAGLSADFLGDFLSKRAP